MAFRKIKNLWASITQLYNAGLRDIADAGAPTNGTSGTGAGYSGPGSIYTNTTNGSKYLNTGTLASPTWVLMGTAAGGLSLVAAGTLSSGTTTATTTAVAAALTTDIAVVSWRGAPQTLADIVATITPAGVLALSYGATVGTAGTIQYAIVRPAS